MIQSNLTELKKDIARRSRAALEQLGDVMQSQLSEEVRDYPRQTKRRYGRGKTGRLAGSPRDVIDSRQLYDSFTLTINPTAQGMRGEYLWDADHAAIVWGGTSKIPPYNWTSQGQKQFDFEEAFSDN